MRTKKQVDSQKITICVLHAESNSTNEHSSEPFILTFKGNLATRYSLSQDSETEKQLVAQHASGGDKKVIIADDKMSQQ